MCRRCTPVGWLFKFLQTPQNWHELRQQTMAAIGVLESGEGEPCIQLLRRMARQIDTAQIRAELVDIKNEDTKAHSAGKKGPRGSRQKVAKARVVGGEFLMKKEMRFQEKEKQVEENAKARAGKVKTKAQNDSVVEKGKGKAVAFSGSAEQKGKEVLYDLPLCTFAHSNNIYRSLLW